MADDEVWRQINDLKDKVHQNDKAQAVTETTLSEIRREISEIKQDNKNKFDQILQAVSGNQKKPIDWGKAARWAGGVIVALIAIITTLVKQLGQSS